MYTEKAKCAYCGNEIDLRQPEITIRYQGMTRIVLHNVHVEEYERAILHARPQLQLVQHHHA